jgi:hypothetical protein
VEGDEPFSGREDRSLEGRMGRSDSSVDGATGLDLLGADEVVAGGAVAAAAGEEEGTVPSLCGCGTGEGRETVGLSSADFPFPSALLFREELTGLPEEIIELVP